MKKIALLLACIVSLCCFTRCVDNMDDLLAQKPEIAFLNEEGYCHADGNYYVGTEIEFKVQAMPNATSESPLVAFNFSIVDLNGNSLVDESATVTTDTLLVTKCFTSQKEGTYVVTATVTDSLGKVNAAELRITLVDPNAGAIGRYEGYVNIAGDVVFDTLLPQQQLDLDSLFARVVLSEGSAPDEVVAIVEIEGAPYSLTCHQQDGQLIMDEIHLTRVLTDLNNLELHFTIDMVGTLEGDRLQISGPVTGTGELNLLLLRVHATMSGQIDGTLERVQEEQ